MKKEITILVECDCGGDDTGDTWYNWFLCTMPKTELTAILLARGSMTSHNAGRSDPHKMLEISLNSQDVTAYTFLPRAPGDVDIFMPVYPWDESMEGITNTSENPACYCSGCTLNVTEHSIHWEFWGTGDDKYLTEEVSIQELCRAFKDYQG